MNNGTEKDVHTEHCCIQHGCKYFDHDCPVVNGTKTQSFPCEDCEHDSEFSYREAIDYSIELGGEEGMRFLKILRGQDFSVVETEFPTFTQRIGSSYFKNMWRY